jgi:hypothetical protein
VAVDFDFGAHVRRVTVVVGSVVFADQHDRGAVKVCPDDVYFGTGFLLGLEISKEGTQWQSRIV